MITKIQISTFLRHAVYAACGLLMLTTLTACSSTKPLPKPKAIAPLPPAELQSAIDRGVQFLVKDQNKDGSWGSATRTKGLNIYAPVPGAHHAFRAGTSALCIMALCEINSQDPAAVKALERAEQWIIKFIPRVRRASVQAIYNVWAHAYGIRALVRMHNRIPNDKTRQARIKKLIVNQIDRLERYQNVSGGWGYYDFYEHTQHPVGMSTSFTTATALLALIEAQQIGVKVDPKLIARSERAILRQRKPDNTYLYSINFKFAPMRGINRPGGSLGRSQVCNLALLLNGRKDLITTEVLEIWLDRLFARNGWLDIGRKRPIPHEAHFAVAGYFFYYGHFYAAQCIEQLPPEKRPFYQAHMGRLMKALQEKDGSWWDYPLYAYHQPYGTAYALMCLHRSKPANTLATATK